jgi:hypothetical protein
VSFLFYNTEVRFGVFTAVALGNGIFWDVARRCVGLVRTNFTEEHVASIFRVERLRKLGMLAVTSGLVSVSSLCASCSSRMLILTKTHRVPHPRRQHSTFTNNNTIVYIAGRKFEGF